MTHGYGIPGVPLKQAVLLAIAEDLGRGDITTDACIPHGMRGEAVFRAREPMVLSGLDVVREVYRQIDVEVEVHDRAKDGDLLEAGASIAHIEGWAASMLMGERVALNFVQRMSGIATLTRQFVNALPPKSHTRIVDTRKTTPGLRAFERYAVRCGGGFNHREDLGAAVLIKDNHIAAAGGISEAVKRAHAHAPHTSRIECEVESLTDLEKAIVAGADLVMLDNFDDAVLKDAVMQVSGRAMVEASGNITVARIPMIAAAGVDVISVGALTHSFKSADIGLDWV